MAIKNRLVSFILIIVFASALAQCEPYYDDEPERDDWSIK